MILNSLKYINLRSEEDIYKPCKWTIPDVDVAEMRGDITCEATDTRSYNQV
jgi:hypothetical protein